MMMPSRLLKSCAIPPVRLPIASIFCACRSCSSVWRRSVMSWIVLFTYKGSPASSRITSLSR